jgi:hypothetical protein
MCAPIFGREKSKVAKPAAHTQIENEKMGGILVYRKEALPKRRD